MGVAVTRKPEGSKEGEGVEGQRGVPAALSRASSHVYIQLEVSFSSFFLEPLACLPPTAAAAAAAEKWSNSSCWTRWVAPAAAPRAAAAAAATRCNEPSAVARAIEILAQKGRGPNENYMAERKGKREGEREGSKRDSQQRGRTANLANTHSLTRCGYSLLFLDFPSPFLSRSFPLFSTPLARLQLHSI